MTDRMGTGHLGAANNFAAPQPEGGQRGPGTA